MFLKNKWFTLVEIIIVVALLWIVAMTFWNLKVDSGITDKLWAFTNKIAWKISNAKTSALIWKWNVTGNNVNIPDFWEADLNSKTSINWAFSIKAIKSSNPIINEKLNIDRNFKINALYCLQKDYDKSFTPKNSQLLAEKKSLNKIDRVQIRFEKTKTRLYVDGSSTPSSCKWLIIETAYITPSGVPVETKTMTFNKLSWVIER